jgi:hypothetical protein
MQQREHALMEDQDREEAGDEGVDDTKPDRGSAANRQDSRNRDHG